MRRSPVSSAAPRPGRTCWYGRDMTAPLGPQDKRMRLRYPGVCRACGASLPAGSDAFHEPATKTVRCPGCPALVAEAPEGPAAPETAVQEVGPDATESALLAVTTDPPTTVDETPPPPAEGVAGASARREYERRSHAREERVRTLHPVLGGLILAMSDEPQSTRAWEQGAVGEELLAKRLSDLPPSVRVLHDRRIPRTRANIDHIVVAPGGIWVVDAKRYKGRRPALRTEGGIFSPRVSSLRIGGRDGTGLVRGAQSQVGRVVAAAGAEPETVAGVLCFLEADWPLFGRPFTVDGILVIWPLRLVQTIVAAPTRGLDVPSVHARLAAAFPPA